MSWQSSPLAVVFAVNAVLAAGVAVAVWRRREAPGAWALALMMVAAAEWTLLRAFEAAAVDVATKAVWGTLKFGGIVSVAPLWLMFVLAYTRSAGAMSARSLAGLWAIPVITVALSVTNEHHRLMWTSIGPSPRDPALLLYGHGPWFWVHLAYAYVLLLAGTFGLLRALFRLRDVLRHQVAALLVAVALPWGGNLVYVAGLSPIPGLDLTPLAFTLSGAVIAWAIQRLDLLDVIPVARETLLERLADGVLVVDARGRIVDVNPATRVLLGLAGTAPIGRDASEMLAPWPAVLEGLYAGSGATGEIVVAGETPRHLEYRTIPLQDGRGRATGRLLSLRDVTAHRAAQEALRLSEARFRALFEHAPDAYYLGDLEGRFVDGNRAAEALIGYRREDLIGKRLHEVGLLDPEDLPRAAGLFARSLAGEPTGPDEFTLRRADGTRLTLEISTSPLTVGGQALVLGIARDTSARRRTQQALRESEERYRDLVENIDELICTHDMEGRLLTVNRSAREKMGYERLEDVVGHSLAEFLTPDVREAFPAYLDLVAREGRAAGLMKVLTRQGEVRYLEFVNTLGRGPRGEPIVRGVSRDVTERRRAEREIRALTERLEQRVLERTAELHRSHERFQRLARVAPIGIYRTDTTGRVTYVNERWSQITGLTPEEALGDDYLRCVHPDDRQAFLGSWAAVEDEAETFRFEGRVRRPDGSALWVVIHLATERDAEGRLIGAVGTLVDITALRHALDEQRRLASIVERSPNLVGISALDGPAVYLNAAGRRLLGLGEHDDVTARHVLEFVAPDVQADVQHRIVPMLIGHGQWEGETRLRNVATGEAVEVEGVAFVVREDAGRILWFAFVARDVRERRLVEAALRERDEQLRQGQKMEAVGRLAGGIAHDFNNLLTVILSQTELLADTLGPGEARRRAVDVLQRTADRAASLTRQLLAFSRKQVLQPRVLDLNDVLAGVSSLLRRLIGEDVELSTVQAPGLGRVRADRTQLEQVIMNLAVNARDAMPRGGRLTLETRNATLDATDLRPAPDVAPGEYVMLAVTDTGTGMSPEVQAHLFEPFFTTKERGKGTGLGLATVYGIVKQHGGHVAVESQPGRGTTFRVYLARVSEAVTAPATPASPATAQAHERVLLVEDDADVRATVSQMLVGLGYAVLEARGPDDALALAERQAGGFDLLLTDVVMSGMSGRELADRLLARWPALPVLFMSGYTDDALGPHGVRDPGVVLLEKPFNRFELGARVRDVLDAVRRPSRANLAPAPGDGA